MLRGAAYPLAPRFLWECLTSRTVSRHQTQRADFPHWAFLNAFPIRGYVTYRTGATFTVDSKQRTRYPLNRPSTL
jgi:hypothetical protein